MRFKGLIILLALLIVACTQIEITHENPIELRSLDFDYDDHGLAVPLDPDKVKLGRVLFYDNLLSLNGNVSCATCHKQEFAFSDDKDFSLGFLDGPTKLNTPPLINIHFNSSFFWDSRARQLDRAVMMPLFDGTEMGLDLPTLLDRVNNAEYYTDLLAAAYPAYGEEQTDKNSESGVTRAQVSEALTAFVSSILSTDSKFDRSRSQNGQGFTHDEEAGKKLFEENCNTCHSALGEAVEDSVIVNRYLGVEEVQTINIGLEIRTGNVVPRSRIPSLRNIGSTAPYMHDGRFETLREVIDHYDDKVKGSSVDGRLRDKEGKIKKLELTDLQKDQLESFLLTLTDTKIETDEKWSDPFIR